jgi:thioredoxin reductase
LALPAESSSRTGAHPCTAIIGAGPFGLALAAKLRAAKADFVLFGRVMSLWREHVPRGTRVLSGPGACSFSKDAFNAAAYESSLGIRLTSPLPAEQFVEYGVWFHRNTCPPADERTVINVTRANGEYRIRVEDGEKITANYVVVAIGMKAFAFRPPGIASLSPEFVSHTSDLRDPASFCGKTLAVIGSGQSALECAALMAENNADVEVLARSNRLNWTRTGSHNPVASPERSSLGFAQNVPSAIRSFLNDPDVYRKLPGFLRARWLQRRLRPAPDIELIPRVRPVRITLGRTVTGAAVKGDRVELRLDDHSTRTVDHVVLGTGYRVDIDAISFLSSELRREIRHCDGYPELNSDMESTVPGLYFAGAAAAQSFGPTMWFVQGAPLAAERICRILVERAGLLLQSPAAQEDRGSGVQPAPGRAEGGSS